MLIDKSHRRWMIVTVVLFLVATGLYVVYATTSPAGPTGGSWQGMMFGIAGTALMLYAGLFNARKKAPAARVGRAQTWLRGHIWLGLLSVPLILFHAGFGWGGLLETILLGLLALIVLSGIFGLMMQIYLPRIMKLGMTAEAMYEQIPAACSALRRTADESVREACGSLVLAASGVVVKGGGADVDDESAGRPLKDFYLRSVRPFLDPEIRQTADLPPTARGLASEIRAAATFDQLRATLPADFHDVLEQLGGICDERRQLMRQQRLHHWLHGWLFVHVPLSMALLVLTILHIITAVYY